MTHHQVSNICITTLFIPIVVFVSIVHSESEFQNHEDIYDLFYTCFACLSAHFISINANNCKYPWYIFLISILCYIELLGVYTGIYIDT